jgi:predicted metallopeptidase
MPTEWSEAEKSVINIAEELIDKIHCHLQGYNIGFLFRSEAAVSKGRVVYAQVQLVPAKLKPLLDYDVIIWVSEEDWNRMPLAHRKALIDHELCHIRKGDNGLTLVGHDVEEFSDVIKRHGMWSADLRSISYDFRNASQIEMELLDKKDGVVTVISHKDREVIVGAAASLFQEPA